ncbi:hypothetical protein [Paenimyroides ummariense]|nr:hypothetical protein [Paenimyroides ummariense]
MEKAYLFNHERKDVFVQGVQSKDLDRNLWTIETYSKNPCRIPNPDTRIIINNMKNLPIYQGLFDSLGQAVLSLEYDNITFGKNTDYAIASKEKRVGVYDIVNKKWIIPVRYEEVCGINSELPLYKAWINKEKHKVDYYDYSGNLILSSDIFIQSFNYQDGKILFYKNGNTYKMYYNKEKQKITWYKL